MRSRARLTGARNGPTESKQQSQENLPVLRDWSNVRKSSGPRAEPPLPERIELCWRMKGPNGRILECAIFRHAAQGVEVRCGFGEDDLIRSQLAPEIGTARDVAEDWRRAVLANGGFAEVAE